MEIKVSVRQLVEFVLRSGNIDNRHSQAPDNAMLEGGRVHRMIQGEMGPFYAAEVTLKYRLSTPMYDLLVEGRADGIEDHEDPDIPVLIDEIKGTYRDIERIKEPVMVHEAQVRCYAYIYALQHALDRIVIRVTYCNFETNERRLFEKELQFGELEEWFMELIGRYRKWADFSCEWAGKRIESIRKLDFPYPYREGQKELVTYVYRTIYHRRKLFIEAPTGVGKTLSTVFPAIKAIGEEKAEKIFYLTAKTITRTVAEQSFLLLQKMGLHFKTVTLTAKEKICFCEEVDCNPEKCPYAKGHYDRINDAIYDFLTHEDQFDREHVEYYARKHTVCPFEMCLDMSLFADAVICDYNYVFDPHVYLKRFFAEVGGREYIFLVDEAHNLVDRGREMYSATLIKEDFLSYKKEVREYSKDIERKLEKCNKELLALKKECENYRIIEYYASFVNSLNRLAAAIEKYLEDHEESPIRKTLLEFYFTVSHFLFIYELMDENYVTYTQMNEDGTFMIRLLCVNPANNLKECMKNARSTVLFSATLLPIQYYKCLLGGEEHDYEVYAHSVFDSNRRGLFIGQDVTSKYTRRSDMEYYNIAAYLDAIIRSKRGNYMVFCPSHIFQERVYEAYTSFFQDETMVECVTQEGYMSEEEREAFLDRFMPGSTAQSWEHSEEWSEKERPGEQAEREKSLVGFCVMGGIFSEGIDLKNDSLIGAILVGTGLPQVCPEREILKSFFDERGENGFDYAYRFPGMNKVLQAAGRVIRTEEDIGVVALLDERFLQPAYQKMFPREWEHFEVVSIKNIKRSVEDFWKKHI